MMSKQEMYPLGSITLPPLFACILYGCPHNRILPSKVSSVIAKPTVTHPLDYHNKKLFHMECSRFSKNSATFQVMCYLMDFIDIAHIFHNFIGRTKLISSFFKEEIELIISKITKFLFRSVIFHGIFWNGNSLILGYSLGIEQSEFSYFQALSALR